MRKHGFTLIELLVVIAIIGILAGLMIPGLAKARKVSELKKQGYSTAEANTIAKLLLSPEGDNLTMKQAAEKAIGMARPESETSPKGVIGGTQSTLPALLGQENDALPAGATEMTPVGNEWYTFKWDGHKYLAALRDTPAGNKLVVCIERLD